MEENILFKKKKNLNDRSHKINQLNVVSKKKNLIDKT